MPPTIDSQREYWDGWNLERGPTSKDDYQQRQARIVADAALRRNRHDLRILEIGCGTGWLLDTLRPYAKSLTGVDLSEAACETGRSSYPGIEFATGDFAALDLPDGSFDFVVAADVIAHVADQAAFVRRVHSLLSPEGTFVLLTQNEWVIKRWSRLRPKSEGQIRDWPTVARIRDLFGTRFAIQRIQSIAPDGDRGVLWFTGNRFSRAVLRRTPVLTRAAERMMLGRELVIEARRIESGQA